MSEKCPRKCHWNSPQNCLLGGPKSCPRSWFKHWPQNWDEPQSTIEADQDQWQHNATRKVELECTQLESLKHGLSTTPFYYTIHIRYYLRIFEQLPHQMADYLSGK